MLYLTEAEARKLGIITSGKIPRKQGTRKIIFQSKADWQAKPIKGGVLLVIPENMPTLNEWKDWSPFKQHSYKKTLTHGISCIANRYRITEFQESNRYARVEITHFHRTNRLRDDDNYAPKFILDALKGARMICDDNHQVLDLPKPVFCTDKECFRTEIRILYIGNRNGGSDVRNI